LSRGGAKVHLPIRRVFRFRSDCRDIATRNEADVAFLQIRSKVRIARCAAKFARRPDRDDTLRPMKTVELPASASSAAPLDPVARRIAARIRAAARLTGRFVLRSGRVADTYFDKYQFEADPDLLRAIADLLARRLPEGTEVVAGLEMGGIPIVTVLSQVTGLPAAFVRKEAKAYGTCRYAEGAPLAGRRVVLIEDVVSTGGALLDAIDKLGGDGIRPIGALCVIDRETGGRDALAAAGVPLDALFTYAQIDVAET
jgi:orotate phosphoribosyltransferase